jgi:hypothetical protein
MLCAQSRIEMRGEDRARSAMKRLCFILCLAVLQLQAHGQQSDVPPGSESQAGPAPAAIVGQLGQIIPLVEGNAPNFITIGVATTQVYSDNPDLNSSSQVSNWSYDIQPHLTLSHSAPHLSYDLGIFAGFILNQTAEEQNEGVQTGSFGMSYRMSAFTTLRLSDSFMNTTGLWSGAGDTGSSSTGGGIGVVQAPNSSLFTFGRFRSNTALGELSHMFNASDDGGFRGTQSYTWFPGSATSSTVGNLIGGNTYSAEAYFNHRFSARHFVGITLRGERFDLDRSQGRTDSGSLLFLYGVNFRPTISLSMFAGPQLSVTSIPSGVSLPVFPERMWTPATGVQFNWQRQRMGLMASFVRQISNGAGLSSAVLLSSADTALQTRLSRRWGSTLGFSYTQNEPIINSPIVRTYSGRGQLVCQLTNNIALSGGYLRTQNATAVGNLSSSANRVWSSFSYNFTRPLGR